MAASAIRSRRFQLSRRRRVNWISMREINRLNVREAEFTAYQTRD